MKPRRTFRVLLAVAPLGAAVLGLAAACSSSESKAPVAAEDAAADVVEELEVAPPVDAAPACKLTTKMTTGVALCDECLQKGCCQVLVACLGEATCSALNTCVNGCRSKFGQGDAGDQCASDCAKGKDEPTSRLTAALDCELTRCGTQCK